MQELTHKMSRQNPGQFDFLKPTHPFFQYFTDLVDQYSKILNPKEDKVEKYCEFASCRDSVLKVGEQRFKWEKYQQEELKYQQKVS